MQQQAQQEFIPSLSQIDFVNSHTAYQWLFFYILRKFIKCDENIKQSYQLCKHFQTSCSVQLKDSIAFLIDNIIFVPNDLNEDKKQCCLNSHLHSSSSQSPNSSTEDLKIIEEDEMECINKDKGQPSYVNGNNAIQQQIKLMIESLSGGEYVLCMSQLYFLLEKSIKYVTQQELIISRLQIQQHSQYEKKQQASIISIQESRLKQLRKVAENAIEKYFSVNDFIYTGYFMPDLNFKIVKLHFLELNNPLMSLLGTVPNQFSGIAMRRGLQFCSKNTDIMDSIILSLKALVVDEEEVVKFVAKDQVLELLDQIIIVNDIDTVLIKNQSNVIKNKKFSKKEIKEIDSTSIEFIMISRLNIPLHFIQKILEMRSQQQQVDFAAQQQQSLGYTVQSELFCDKFYPQVREKNNLIVEEERQEIENSKRTCNFKKVN